MTIEELGKMADDYARELAPDNKDEQTAISADSLGFLDKVMAKYCLTEKSKVVQACQNAKTRIKDGNELGILRMAAIGFAEVSLLQYLFPDIAKEVEDVS